MIHCTTLQTPFLDLTRREVFKNWHTWNWDWHWDTFNNIIHIDTSMSKLFNATEEIDACSRELVIYLLMGSFRKTIYFQPILIKCLGREQQWAALGIILRRQLQLSRVFWRWIEQTKKDKRDKVHLPRNWVLKSLIDIHNSISSMTSLFSNYKKYKSFIQHLSLLDTRHCCHLFNIEIVVTPWRTRACAPCV